MRVILIEDHALFREGITLILQQLGDDIEVACGESETDALALAKEPGEVDLILLDYHLANSNGLDCLENIQPLRPKTPVIMLSAEQDKNLIQTTLSKGARGFITKSSSSKVMLSAIQLVLSGGVYVPLEMLQEVQVPAPNVPTPNAQNTNTEVESHQYHLTARQLDVLAHMLEGQSNKEIAKVLNMSPSTVKVHVAAILRELEVKNRTQAVNIAKTQNILGLD